MLPSAFRADRARLAVPARIRRRRQAVLVSVLSVAVLSTAPASADVLHFTYGDGDDGVTHPVLVHPDGSRIALAPFPEPPKSSGPRPAAVDPTRRFVARVLGTRIAVLPLDGSPTRIVRAPGVRADEDASVWWSADGSVLTAGPVRTRDGAAGIRRCTMPTLQCTVVRTGRWVAVGGAPGGGTLLTRDGARGTAGRIARATDGKWHRRSAAWVRRTRALLNRPLSDALRLDRSDGTPVRTVWRSDRPLVERTTTITPLAPAGDATGALLQWADSRVALSVRRRDGVLSARLSPVRLSAAGYWQVTTDGRRRSLGRLASTPAVPRFPTPDGDWVAVLDALTEYGDRRLGTVAADGAVRSLTVGGRRVTWRNLHSALGLPRSTRLPTPDPDFGPDQYEWVPVGVEAATRSVVVLTGDRRDAVILARVSLDGARPTIVDRQREFDVAEVLVW